MAAFEDFLLSGVNQLATGLINDSMSRRNARDQRDWQEKMWREQNEYNSPSRMADRMRAAGLNPFTMTGAEPAGSVGTGSMAQTIPINDPLSTLKVFAEYDNIVAQTGKTETETAKMLKDISMLDLLYEKGLLEKDEYQYRLNKIKEAYDKANPYELENQQTASEIAKNEAQAAESTASAGVKEAETSLKEAQTAFQEAVTEYQKVLTSNADAESKARVEQMTAQAAASYASAYAANVQATYYSDKNDRESEQHAMNLSIDEIKKQGMLTENQANELKQKVNKAWNEGVFGPDAKDHRWQNFETIVNDFFHNNLNLSGGGAVTKNIK